MYLLSFLIAIFSLNLYAQGPHACAGDVQKYCQGIPKTRAALNECLKKNESKLGPSCKAVRESFLKESREKNKCHQDIEKFCADKSGVTELNQCLKNNEAKLSKGCIEQKNARVKEKMPCKADQEKFCSDDKRGKMSVTHCMLINNEKFSAECKNARAEYEKKLLVRQPCFNDAVLYCDDKKKDPASLEQCLDENNSKLSATCTKHRKSIDDKMAARNPCYKDAVKLCPQERFKPELLKLCLEKNKSKLSQLCQDTRNLAERQQKNIKASCVGDEKKFCNGVSKKGNAIVSCLKANLGKISFQCRKAITD